MKSGRIETAISIDHILIKKWHEDNGQYEYCSLRQLWENGFNNGQCVQEHNKHLLIKQYLSEDGFYAKPEFFDDVYKTFWNDLKGAEIVIDMPSVRLTLTGKMT